MAAAVLSELVASVGYHRQSGTEALMLRWNGCLRPWRERRVEGKWLVLVWQR